MLPKILLARNQNCLASFQPLIRSTSVWWHRSWKGGGTFEREGAPSRSVDGRRLSTSPPSERTLRLSSAAMLLPGTSRSCSAPPILGPLGIAQPSSKPGAPMAGCSCVPSAGWSSRGLLPGSGAGPAEEPWASFHSPGRRIWLLDHAGTHQENMLWKVKW